MPDSRPDPKVVHAVVGVLRETQEGERRVALVPALVAKLLTGGFEVLVETGAGAEAWFTDAAYLAAGAEVLTRAQVLARATVCVGVQPIAASELRDAQAALALLQPALHPGLVEQYVAKGVTALSFAGLPRTLSRAQAMDVLTSQASVAGYKAAVLAADTYGGYLPMMMTATGTIRPAKVLVLGGGVAGLQAMGTALRLGAVVKGYDVRAEARGDIESVGATFVSLDGSEDAAGSGGYARQLTASESLAQQAALQTVVAAHDIVISTAQVPGRVPPVLVTTATLDAMRPGSVLVDLAASVVGGNVVGSVPGRTTTTPAGVTVIGADNLPSSMAAAASTAYAASVHALLVHLWLPDGFHLDLADPIQDGVVLAHDHRANEHRVDDHPEVLEPTDTQERTHELHPVR